MSNICLTYLKHGKLRIVVRDVDEDKIDEVLHTLDSIER